ncbi:hypothetical protein SEA_GALACTICA_80 [Streptomyces phage Galactica]|nr:hypothetical protein SEA_GALACTICA_80 [Streptomyces phage Galactica]
MTASSNGQTVTRPQTPKGQPYVPNQPRPEAYTGTVKAKPAARPRRSGR